MVSTQTMEHAVLVEGWEGSSKEKHTAVRSEKDHANNKETRYMTWDELNEALIKVAWDVNYIAVDEDGRVTVEVSNVDTSEPIPAYTGLNFEVKT